MFSNIKKIAFQLKSQWFSCKNVGEGRVIVTMAGERGGYYGHFNGQGPEKSKILIAFSNLSKMPKLCCLPGHK